MPAVPLSLTHPAMMIRATLMALAAGALLSSMVGCKPQGEGTAAEEQPLIAWTTDLSSALQQAAQAGKPVMVDFFATWCGPCKMLDAQTYRDPRMVAEATNWVTVKIDVDQNGALAERFRIEAVPTILLRKPDGSMAGRTDGFLSADELLAQMRTVRTPEPGTKPGA